MFRYKKYKDDIIIKIIVLGDSNEKRTDVYDPEFAIYRCSKFQIVDIYDMNTNEKYTKIDNININSIFEDKSYDIDFYIIPTFFHYYLTEKAAYWCNYKLNKKDTKTIYSYCRNGSKHEEYQIIKGKIEGVYKKWYDNAQLWKKINYSKGIINGEMITYHNNGIINRKCNYINGVLDGEYSTTDCQGNMENLSFYKNNKKINFEKSWKNGILVCEKIFLEDNINIIKIYNKNGTPFSENYYIDNQNHGIQKFWDNDGEYYEYNYDKGILIYKKNWYKKGNLKYEKIFENDNDYYKQKWHENGIRSFESKIVFQNSIKSGYKNFWYENGQKSHELVYEENGELELQKSWYENGKLKYIKQNDYREGWYENGNRSYLTNYQNNIKNGIDISCHDNKIIRSQQNYNKGQLEGLQKYWNREGILILEEERFSDMLHGKIKEYSEDGKLLREQTYRYGTEII